jgi:septal ring factor EnvC (AmiA/AmiB activator)
MSRIKVEIVTGGVIGPKGRELRGVREFDVGQAMLLVEQGKARLVDSDVPVADTELLTSQAETVEVLQKELEKANQTIATLNDELLKTKANAETVAKGFDDAKATIREQQKRIDELAAQVKAGKDAQKKNGTTARKSK